MEFGWVLDVFPYVKPSKNLQEPPQDPPGTLRNPQEPLETLRDPAGFQVDP